MTRIREEEDLIYSVKLSTLIPCGSLATNWQPNNGTLPMERI